LAGRRDDLRVGYPVLLQQPALGHLSGVDVMAVPPIVLWPGASPLSNKDLSGEPLRLQTPEINWLTKQVYRCPAPSAVIR